MDKVLAGLVLAVCAVLMLRLAIGERRRYRFDATLRHWALSLRRRAHAVWHWRASKRAAEQAAADAIRRAQKAAGQWDGNVYKPDSFRKPPNNKLH